MGKKEQIYVTEGNINSDNLLDRMMANPDKYFYGSGKILGDSRDGLIDNMEPVDPNLEEIVDRQIEKYREELGID